MCSGEVVRRVIPDGGFAFARRSIWLACGLELALINRFDSGGLYCWTVAYPGVTDERLTQLKTGGVVAGLVESVVRTEVASTLRGCADGRLFAPDPMRGPHGPFLDRDPVKYLVLDDSVYCVERSPTPDGVAQAWRYTGSAPVQMAIVTAHHIGSALHHDDLQAAANQALLLIFTPMTAKAPSFSLRTILARDALDVSAAINEHRPGVLSPDRSMQADFDGCSPR